MRASHQHGHARERMEFDQLNQCFRCRCGERVTPEAILGTVPAPYRPSRSEIGRALQSMADYEIEGVVDSLGRIHIEYPRPSIDR